MRFSTDVRALCCSAAALAAVAVSAAQQTSLSLSGSTLNLGGIPYFVPPTPASQFSPEDLELSIGYNLTGLIPFSVIATPNSAFDTDAFESLTAAYAAQDDVWSKAFLTGVYITYNGTAATPCVSSRLAAAKETYGITHLLYSKSYGSGIDVTPPLPTGPYFVDPSTGNVFEAYRLYNDEQQSFVYGTIPDGSGGFQVLPAKIPGAATESIGVPSRLYFTPTPEQPFAGYRLAVKDIYDVQGLRTGCGNRAYWALYPSKNQSAFAVQRLLDAGMVLVAKAKTSQFANGEVATDDWVDLHAPYNPRGDGYQDGGSSSTGPGTSMAAYDWLDFAIGSDTGGSMRSPAGADGVYGNRPSHGAISTDGVMPLSPALDTLGIFSRDANLWASVGQWWYQNFTSYSTFPKKIIFPTDFFGSSYLTNPPAPGTSDATFNDFITKLEAFLGTQRTEIDFADLWAQAMPSNELGITTAYVYPTLITMDQTKLLAEPFMADYAAANGGRKPFIDPAPLIRWQYGWSQPPEAYDEAIANKTLFMNWFAEQMVPTDPTTCSESIFLYPQSDGYPTYRNAYTGPPGTPIGFSASRIAVFAETPDMVIPIGEAAYNSTITGLTEYLPVTLSVLTAKNCDLMLFNLFAVLQDAGILSPMTTGSRLYTPESIEE